MFFSKQFRSGATNLCPITLNDILNRDLTDTTHKAGTHGCVATTGKLSDPYNLLAVDGPSNQKKSDGDAATWLPKNKPFRCEYVARQIGAKAKYSLWVTKAERKAMTKVLKKCPAQTVPLSDESQRQAEQQAQQQNTNVHYQNCAVVRAAGKAPLYQGQPRCSTKLDRDHDGVACE